MNTPLNTALVFVTSGTSQTYGIEKPTLFGRSLDVGSKNPHLEHSVDDPRYDIIESECYVDVSRPAREGWDAGSGLAANIGGGDGSWNVDASVISGDRTSLLLTADMGCQLTADMGCQPTADMGYQLTADMGCQLTVDMGYQPTADMGCQLSWVGVEKTTRYRVAGPLARGPT